MKALIFVITFLITTTAAAEDKDYILLSEITEETFTPFLEQYTETCRPFVRDIIGAAAYAANEFNKGRYDRADRVLQRMDKQMILELMTSDDCTLEDIRITMAQSESLEPIRNSTVCLLRVNDSMGYYQESADALERNELKEALNHLNRAQFALDDVTVGYDSCRFLPDERKQSIADLKEIYASMIKDFEEVVNPEE